MTTQMHFNIKDVKNFIFYGPKIWNLVLPYIKDEAYNIPVTVQQYKNKFKKFLLKM